jgi:hypothetical protein
MNTFAKLFFAASVITSSYVAAQDEINIVDLPNTINKDYSFDGLWKISNNSQNNTYQINGSRLVNYTNKTTDFLYLDLYFVPSNASINLYELPNKINTRADLGQLEGNGTSFSNVSVNFKDSDIRALNQGKYTPVLLLKEKSTGNIVNYKILSNKISLETNEIFIDKKIDASSLPLTLTDPGKKVISNEKLDASLSNIYTTVGSELDLTNANEKLRLVGIWQLEIDYQTMIAKIEGINNAIQNLDSKPTSKLKLLIYFSKEDIKDSKEVSGYELLNVDVLPLTGHTKVDKPVFTTNLTKLVPKGDYYPILVLTEQNNEGNYIIKSTMRMGDIYTIQ